MIGILQIVFVVCYASTVIGGKDENLNITDLSQCNIQIEAVGCYNDDVKKRVLTEQVLNSRDGNSPVYIPPDLSGYWKKYPHFLANFICECAKKVLKENRGPYFGIQFYAECWSGLKDKGDGDIKIDMHGEEDNNCIDTEFNPYNRKEKNCGAYSGKRYTNYIYRLTNYTENACPEYFKSIGCFRDNQVRPRPLPIYLMNERDVTTTNWNNRSIDWKHWDTYMPGFICRCATEARKKKFRYFGIQYYGECWAGNDRDSISKIGEGKPSDCINQKFDDCPTLNQQVELKGCLPYPCAGVQLANYAYELTQGPLACASNPCLDGERCRPNGPTKYECVPAQ